VPPKQPQIAGPGHCRFGKRRRGVRFFLVVKRQETVDLAWIESRQREIEIRFLDLLQLNRK
jgi:hypothetical protein